MSMFNELLESIEQLVKYAIVSNLNFDDRVFSNILQTVILVIIQLIINGKLYAKFKSFYTGYDFTNGITDTNVKMIEFGYDKENKKSVDFVKRLVQYIKRTIPGNRILSVRLDTYNTSKYAFDDTPTHINTILSYIEIDVGKIIPIYRSTNGYVGITRIEPPERADAKFCYNTIKALEEFVAMFQDKPDTYHGELEIYSHANVKIGKIDPHNTLTNYISDDIDDIRKAINKFKLVNSSNTHNIRNNYNLGIILYGTPGTGKTHLVKTIACELRYNVRVVKLSLVKTTTEFAEILSKKETVYLFDEFDLMLDNIATRECKDQSAVKEDLYNKQLKLMKIIPPNDAINAELADIRKQLNDLKDAFNLESMLTVLSGIEDIKGRVICATTNRIHHIDSALLRPGRFDFVIKLDKYSSATIKKYMSIAYDCVATVDFKPISPAELKLICSLYDTYEEACRDKRLIPINTLITKHVEALSD